MVDPIGCAAQLRGSATAAATRRHPRRSGGRSAAKIDDRWRIGVCSQFLMEAHMRLFLGACLAISVLVAGCTAREAAWLVPRATVGFALQTHEGRVAGAGFVTLIAPFERPVRTPRRAQGSTRRMRLLGEGAPCRLTEVCRWEGRARAEAIADAIEDTTSGSAP